jgi:hypothetical protein
MTVPATSAFNGKCVKGLGVPKITKIMSGCERSSFQIRITISASSSAANPYPSSTLKHHSPNPAFIKPSDAQTKREREMEIDREREGGREG